MCAACKLDEVLCSLAAWLESPGRVPFCEALLSIHLSRELGIRMEVTRPQWDRKAVASGRSPTFRPATLSAEAVERIRTLFPGSV